MPKKAIILDQGKGQLANQLWNFMSIYAYSLERGLKLENYAFRGKRKTHGKKPSIPYHEYFDFKIQNKFIKWIFFSKFGSSKLATKLRIYYFFTKGINKIKAQKVLSSGNHKTFYLPPTPNQEKKQKNQIAMAEKKNGNIYFSGSMFRNPAGWHKYRNKIIEYFKPKKSVLNFAKTTTEELKEKYEHIVGVHMRQGDYKQLFENGKYYFNSSQVAEILKEYLKEFNKDSQKTVFLICSDGEIEQDKFKTLNIEKSNGNAVEDLFTLSQCDIIIGSNSSYGAFAAYWGNVVHIVFERPQVEWQFYKDKNKFFENQKCSLVHF